MPLLGGLEGRASGCVVTPAGRCMPALLLQRGMRLQADLFWEYQLQQRRSDEVEVLVVPKGEYGDTLAAELSRHLEAFLGNEVHVVVSRVGHIPRDPPESSRSSRPASTSSLDRGQDALAQPDGIRGDGQKRDRLKWDGLKWGTLPTGQGYVPPGGVCLNVKVPRPPTRRSPAPP